MEYTCDRSGLKKMVKTYIKNKEEE